AADGKIPSLRSMETFVNAKRKELRLVEAIKDMHAVCPICEYVPCVTLCGGPIRALWLWAQRARVRARQGADGADAQGAEDEARQSPAISPACPAELGDRDRVLQEEHTRCGRDVG